MRWLALPLALIAASASAQDKTDPARLSAIVKTLASDEFEGRAPGTPGETRTIDYLVARFNALGLAPGGPDGQWTQPVPLIHTRLAPDIAMKAGGLTLVQGKDIIATTVRAADRVAITDAPMVFVGYGVTAPEVTWDDFKNHDLTGKVAVFLVNDPDFEAVKGDGAFGRFGGRRMTYYGRWTYKFEEAARRGAIAALIVHDTDAAGYPWSTAAASNGENYDIVRKPDDPRIALQAWIEHDAADRLFDSVGLDLSALRKAARSASFRPVAMNGLTFSAAAAVSVERLTSANVIAKIPGTTHADETILFGAHWDAYGKGPADADGRTIRPGANDDALGTAGVIELARLFRAGPKPQRSLVFALWTGEERGLLGSEHYAANPVYPLGTTVANLTLDILQTAGPANDVVLVGNGNSTLDADLARASTAQGRTITPETFSERGLFYRADHFSLARRGVPALLIMALGGASDLKDGGRAAGQAWLDGYMACYHKTCDAWAAGWNLAGAAADVDLFHTIGARLADSRDWPAWRKGSEFEGVRASTAADRR